MSDFLATFKTRRKRKVVADPFAKGAKCPDCGRKMKGKTCSACDDVDKGKGCSSSMKRKKRRHDIAKSLMSSIGFVADTIRAKRDAVEALRAEVKTSVHPDAYAFADDYDIRISVPITKIDDEKRMVYGWASVISKDGKPVVDTQGDLIEADALTKMAHGFMRESRVGGLMHMRDGEAPVSAGSIVESFVATADVQKALGIDFGQEGWIIGYHVENDAVWKAVKSGKFPAFSIGGKGKRVAA